MSRTKKLPKTGDNPEIILCKKSKRFENLIVCTYQCYNRCEEYKKKFKLELLYKYLDNHPDYEMKGIIMATSKKSTEKTPVNESKNSKKEKIYWIINEDNHYDEVTESEIINNPAQYLGKPMFEKPKDQYEIIVTIKKKS